ncbi:phosphosulfolactate synthase [Kitasatospora kifunensis]|uniref:Phosphosulfolactate synthase n=1 Tax=Kitasatospora kifunensis TaxID=58351 RepID=A0A7W7VYP3_KITKI|nr:phosphosulfolactate synthase [Kitasatospora kifunensis]MBB4926909.1 phosphosulfolactate synthase [Kitasatospora kifunensis]
MLGASRKKGQSIRMQHNISDDSKDRIPRPTDLANTCDIPDFLALPERAKKPRRTGVTHVLDKGMPTPVLEALLLQRADLVDFLKIGWGTAYVDPSTRERIAVCAAMGVKVCLGGTLLEVSAAQQRLPELCRWAARIGVDTLEVSNGLQLMTRHRKAAVISELAQDFTVLAETGAKSKDVPVVAAEWADELESDLESGAQLVITEGRESGTVGLYDSDGAVRPGLVDAITNRLPLEKVIFEAPKRAQQVWLIERFGTGVNLGNVALDEVIPLETSRLGLRADTAGLLSVAVGLEEATA